MWCNFQDRRPHPGARMPTFFAHWPTVHPWSILLRDSPSLGEQKRGLTMAEKKAAPDQSP